MGEPFTVAGIIKKIEEFEPVINSIEEYNTYYSSNGGLVLIQLLLAHCLSV